MRTQQFDLYRAERSVDLGRRFASYAEVRDYVIDLVNRPFWERYSPCLNIEVCQKTRRGNDSVGAWFPDSQYGYIEMNVNDLNENIVLHEISHCIAQAQFGSTSHDPYFAKTYLELVFLVRGVEPWTELKAAFDQAGIVYDERLD